MIDKKPMRKPSVFMRRRPPSGRITEDKLKIIVLGGNEEIGRNMSVLEYGNDIIIIDMGLQFPEEDMPGIDYIIPNTDYLKGKEKNIRGVIITHGHLDHIGGIPHLMAKLGNPPIFSSDLTLAIVNKRQDDYKQSGLKLNLKQVRLNDKIRLGTFEVEFFGVSHNIPTSMGLIVHTPCGIVVHTGDFKIDLDSRGDTPVEISKMARLGEGSVLAVMCDSTNASQTGHQLSESEIEHNLEDIVRNATGRLIMGTFGSLLCRIQQIIWAAEKFNKKVTIQGFSMRTNVEIAQQLGYLKIKKGTLIGITEIHNIPPEKLIIICTGAQGEDNASLMKIATHEHKYIQVEKGDTIVFSSSVIPGNERSVQRLKDNLLRQGAEVIHYQMMDVHAGGHAKTEDIKLFLNLVRPKYFIPIEGQHSFLHQNAKHAVAVGIPRERVFITDNGQVMEFDRQGNGILTEKRVPTDYVFVDGLGVGDVSEVVLRDRQRSAPKPANWSIIRI
ncbi:MAG: ribonuclease J [Candidatus Komeilibacteria bacterium]|nr:ribonuclease J [Candidatus Komeilibacteria bacterium]